MHTLLEFQRRGHKNLEFLDQHGFLRICKCMLSRDQVKFSCMKIRMYDCLAESQTLGLLVWRNAPQQIIQAWEGCPVKMALGLPAPNWM